MNDPFEGFPYTPPSKNLQRGDLVRVIGYNSPKPDRPSSGDLAVIVDRHSTSEIYQLFDGKKKYYLYFCDVRKIY
jgi:hypothetical protein